VAGHHLEDVPGGDVGLRPIDDGPVVLAAHRGGEAVGLRARPAGWRGRGGDQVEAYGLQAGAGGGPGPLRRQRRGPHSGRQQNLLGDAVEHRHHGGADHHRIWQAHGVRVDLGQALDEPHHIVAQGAEDAGRHGRQARGQIKPRSSHKVAQGVQGAARLGREPPARDVFTFGDLGDIPPAAPDQVGIQGDHRVPAPPGAALDAFEKEGVGPAVSDLQVG